MVIKGPMDIAFRAGWEACYNAMSSELFREANETEGWPDEDEVGKWLGRFKKRRFIYIKGAYQAFVRQVKGVTG